MREALDGIDMDFKNKMQETTDTLLGQINENVKRNSEGKHTYFVQSKPDFFLLGLLVFETNLSLQENTAWIWRLLWSRRCWSRSPAGWV